ncbi:hypothetical protein A2961_02750 [Candidatus Woesebacteria bacterium RIFCSPLOWO2_01_FULL_39_21]|uniref:GlcNAc-PI de-N-acetylase n=1 Tax=Candidatus Woesebacteria bacterium RIFCSPLOWO2_01_FULL_39_21 TaxID=1802519 RepID=A0A1F8BE76_9BACT|nr:MAG: hypothetical protein A2691_04585 [Candidatus Woesebacteria bacterium RIFCSPHIGHO2_01_FULL_39_23]OGM61959.1 MAG: hypothetical protein A2961_02750 [Candidatus Woesebacteria bacterium RIFCSPLOWO2_01_FULL_39_21]
MVEIVIFTFALIFLILVILWLLVFFKTNDLSVKSLKKINFKKVLVVFPHPDDEILSCGGLIKLLSKKGADSTLIFLTKGEKGTTDAHMEHILRKLRTKEAKLSGKILNYTRTIVKDFGDGRLSSKTNQITKYIELAFAKYQPELVITYDLSGLYGHEDHITNAKVVTDVIRRRFKKIKLWYFSPNKNLLSKIKLPEHMAKDPKFKEARTTPTHKVYIGTNVFAKIKAFYAHKSQMKTLGRGRPFKPLPKWFFLSTLVYEYFFDAN